jgi:hypothetical protein
VNSKNRMTSLMLSRLSIDQIHIGMIKHSGIKGSKAVIRGEASASCYYIATSSGRAHEMRKIMKGTWKLNV